MGLSNSHILEYEAARKSFSEYERARLDDVFNKMSSDNGRHVKVIEKESFQVRLSHYRTLKVKLSNIVRLYAT